MFHYDIILNLLLLIILQLARQILSVENKAKGFNLFFKSKRGIFFPTKSV